MKKLILISAAALIAVGSPAFSQQGTPKSGTNSPTRTNDNPSACLGAERAGRNSNGGDRAQGGFGPAQRAEVQRLRDEEGMNYGEALAAFKAMCARNGTPVDD
jgi:hypothetical protein